MITQSINPQAPVVQPQAVQPQEAQRQKQAAPVELPQQSVQALEEKPTVEQLKTASDQINRVLSQFDRRNLQFSVDEDTGIDVVKVVDTDSDEVIRQIPSETVIQIARVIDKLQGLLISDKV